MLYYFKAFQNFVNFNGRARRREYWYFALFHVIFAVIVAIISEAVQVPLLYSLYVLSCLDSSIGFSHPTYA